MRGGNTTVDGRASDVTEAVGTAINTDVETDYANGTALYNILHGSTGPGDIQAAYVSFQGSSSSLLKYIQSLVQFTLRAMATLDQGGNINTMMSLQASVQLLITQMVSGSAFVKANVPALGAQTNVGTPTGTPTIIGTVKSGTGQYSGQEYLIAETITFAITKDSYGGGATANQESFSITGQPAQSDVTSWDWPKGSGKTGTGTIVDPSINNTATTAGIQSVLVNGAFETWTNTNVADNWTYLVGTAGTDAQRGSTAFASSTYAFEFLGGTGINTAITQTFNTPSATGIGAGGSPWNPLNNLQQNLIFNMQIKYDVQPAAGVITVDLVDGTNSVINDTNGTANSFTVSINPLTASFQSKSGVFRLPLNPPSTIKLRIRMSTALSAGSNVFIDDVALVKAVPFYASGPAFVAFRGATKPIIGDSWTLATSISAAGAFQRFMQKCLGLDTLSGGPYYLPSKADASETELDTLIA